jgi:hypothetical protein
MARDTGGPAFPQFEPERIYHGGSDRIGEEVYVAKDGMSLRDYFAGQVLANAALMSSNWEVGNETSAARNAYVIADAMLRERAK